MFLVSAAMTVPFDYGGALRAGQSLAIRDVNGSVRLRTGDRFTIHAVKRAEHGDANAVAIKVESGADGVVVCVRYPPDANRGCGDRNISHGDNDNDTNVEFDVVVPHGVRLDASTVNGSLDVVNDGATDVATVNGSIRVEAREVRRAITVNGSIAATVLDRSRTPLDAKTVNGSIRIVLPAGSGVALDARTLTGGISAEGVTVERPQFGPGAHASGTIGDGARRVTLATVNGSITVRR